MSTNIRRPHRLRTPPRRAEPGRIRHSGAQEAGVARPHAQPKLLLATAHPRRSRSHSHSPPGRKVESGSRSAQVPPTGGAGRGGMRKSRAGFRRRHCSSQSERAGRRGAVVSGPRQVMLRTASSTLPMGHRGLASCVGRWRGDGAGEKFVQGTLSPESRR